MLHDQSCSNGQTGFGEWNFLRRTLQRWFMFHYYREIDEEMFTDIQKYEEQQFSKFRKDFDGLCSGISELYGWNYSVDLQRWMDPVCKRRNKPLDGYTATLQIDFTDSGGKLIEIDENVATFFENITYISYIPIRRKYRVFQNELLEDIRAEIMEFIHGLEKFC